LEEERKKSERGGEMNKASQHLGKQKKEERERGKL